MAFAGLEPAGAARNRYEAAPVQPPAAASEPEDFDAADDEHDPADDVWTVPPQDLREAIRERMQENGMTQTELARRIGLANSTGVSSYLKAGKGLGRGALTKACDLLGIEVTGRS